jgi:RNA polymerase sigma-70 factor (ECF subfamily)
MVGSPEEAEEVLQEAMLNAFRNLRRFEGRSQFSTWLTRIVINTALMRLRARKQRRDVSLDATMCDGDLSLAERLPAAGPDPEQVYARRELRAKIERSVAQLSPVLRSTFLMREVQGLSTKRAAALLKVPIGTVKARLHRAKNHLRCALSRPREASARHTRGAPLRPAVSPCTSD